MRHQAKTTIAIFIAFWLVFGLTQPAGAFHFPWDQGHDTFKPVPPPPKGDPCKGDECDPCKKAGSPVAFDTGGFSYKRTDFFIPGLGFSLEVTRTYNSLDIRNGPFGHGWVYNYDIRLIEVTDEVQQFVLIRQPNGQRDRYLRNADGSYQAQTSSVFDTLVKNVDGTFTLTREDGSTLGFNAAGFLTMLTDRNGNTTTLAYDDTNAITSVTDPSGRALTFTKGPNGRIRTVRDFVNRTYTYDYDADGNLIGVTDPLGNTFNYTYDSSHNLLTVISPKADVIVQVTYDTSGRVDTLVDGEGNFQYFYDNPSVNQVTRRDNTTFTNTVFTLDPTTKRVVSITDPNNNSIQRTYDARGMLISSTDKKGNATTRVYDSNGRLQSLTNGINATETFTYTASGDLASISSPSGNVINYEYDASGRLVKAKDGVGTNLEREISFTYDASGLLASVTDPNGNTTSYQYDAAGRLTSITDPLGNDTVMTYSSIGTLSTRTDANGNAITYSYDDLGRPTTITDPLGNSVDYSYDENGNLTSITDENGHATTYEYDGFNRLTRITDPLSQSVSYTYDARGKRTGRSDPISSTSYSYDSLSRLTNINFSGGSESYTYDNNGNLTGVNTNASNFSYDYDAIDRMISVSSSTIGKTMAYTYAPDVRNHPGLGVGLRTAITDGEGGTIQYEYDVLSRLTKITNQFGEDTTFTYDPGDRLTSKTFSNGSKAVYTYDAANRLTSITYRTAGNQLIASRNYTYDAVGNRLSSIDEDGNTTMYTYDTKYRLVSASAPGRTETFTYDAAYNRLTMIDASGTTTYTYDAADRLLTEDRPDPLGDVTYEYNNANNLVTKTVAGDTSSVTRYTYDGQNRLTRIQYPDFTTNDFTYGMGWIRFSKTDSAGTRRYLYDNQSILAEYDGSNTRTIAYTVGDERSGKLDDLISERIIADNSSRFYLQDALGSTIGVLDESQNSVAEFQYDAFGSPTAETGSDAGEIIYLFTGRQLDRESLLFYYRHRYYDAHTGRFLTSDPAGQVDGANLYAYVRDNPTTLLDPAGLATIDPSCNAAQKARIERAIERVKNTVNNPSYKCYMGKTLGQGILDKLNTMTVKCNVGCGANPNTYGITPGSDNQPANYTVMCNLAFNDGTDQQLEVTIFHETIHAVGRDEDVAYGCENRCYEGRGAVKPPAGEKCGDCK